MHILKLMHKKLINKFNKTKYYLQTEMAQAYTQLFNQLYHQKFCITQTPKNSIERVKMLQKKIRQSRNRQNFTQPLKKMSQNQVLDIPQNYKSFSASKIIRFTQTKTAPGIRSHYQNQSPREKDQNPKIIENTYRRNSYSSQRSKHQSRNSIYAPKQFSLLKQQSINLKLDLKQKINKQTNQNPQNSSNMQRYRVLSDNRSSQRVKTPSKLVYIGGHNLEQQAQSHRDKIRKFEKQLNKYNREAQNSGLENGGILTRRRKTVKYRIQSRKANRSEQKKIIQLKTRDANNVKDHIAKCQKEENIQLLPWSMVSDYQFY